MSNFEDITRKMGEVGLNPGEADRVDRLLEQLSRQVRERAALLEKQQVKKEQRAAELKREIREQEEELERLQAKKLGDTVLDSTFGNGNAKADTAKNDDGGAGKAVEEAVKAAKNADAAGAVKPEEILPGNVIDARDAFAGGEKADDVIDTRSAFNGGEKADDVKTRGERKAKKHWSFRMFVAGLAAFAFVPALSGCSSANGKQVEAQAVETDADSESEGKYASLDISDTMATVNSEDEKEMSNFALKYEGGEDAQETVEEGNVRQRNGLALGHQDTLATMAEDDEISETIGAMDGYNETGMWASETKEEEVGKYAFANAREVAEVCYNDIKEMAKYLTRRQTESFADYLVGLPEVKQLDGFKGLSLEEAEAKLESLTPEQYDAIRNAFNSVIDEAKVREKEISGKFGNALMRLKDPNGPVTRENMELVYCETEEPNLKVTEFYWVDDEGNEIGSMLVKATPIHDDDGNIVGYELCMQVIHEHGSSVFENLVIVPAEKPVVSVFENAPIPEEVAPEIGWTDEIEWGEEEESKEEETVIEDQVEEEETKEEDQTDEEIEEETEIEDQTKEETEDKTEEETKETEETQEEQTEEETEGEPEKEETEEEAEEEIAEEPENEPEKRWGKSGDPHGDQEGAIEQSDLVNPEKEAPQEYIETVNEGKRAYIDDNKAAPGSPSENNGVNEEGFAESGILAPEADTEGGRLEGGADQSADENGASEMAGENAYQDQTVIEEGMERDETGNEAQEGATITAPDNSEIEAGESGSGETLGEEVVINPEAGQDNLTDSQEEWLVNQGGENF